MAGAFVRSPATPTWSLVAQGLLLLSAREHVGWPSRPVHVTALAMSCVASSTVKGLMSSQSGIGEI